jgi:hypothetical protein
MPTDATNGGASSSPPPLFDVVFEHSQTIRHMVDMVASVLPRATYTLCQRGGTRGGGDVCLAVDCMDADQVCLVQARLVGKWNSNSSSYSPLGGGERADVSFCVKSDLITTCLRHVSPKNAVVLSCASPDKIDMTGVDLLTGETSVEFTLDTLHEDAEKMELEDLDFDHIAEVNVPAFKGILEMANQLGAHRITLALFRRGAETVVEVRGKGDKGGTFVRRLPTQSDMDGDVEADDAAREGKRARRDASGSEGGGAAGYEAAFGLKQLSKFVKAMQQEQMTLKIGKGQPLLIDYPLGVSGSYVKLLLAFKTDEED